MFIITPPCTTTTASAAMAKAGRIPKLPNKALRRSDETGAVALDQAHGLGQADGRRHRGGVFLHALLEQAVPVELRPGLGMLFQVGLDEGVFHLPAYR